MIPKILLTSEPGFETRFARLSLRALAHDESDASVHETVAAIVREVRRRGDAALVDYSRQFDARPSMSFQDIEVPRAQWERARAQLPTELVGSLERAAERLERFHAAQKASLGRTIVEDEIGSLRLEVRPLERVGVYVPGGTAFYPSTVLMNVIPAKVAGVSEVVMCTPAKNGSLSDVVLAAAAIAGADRVLSVGGAQAIAALAFGTESVARVDKIVGPGNAYVAEAKRQVFGFVDIDQIAGPSEVLVIADETANPAIVAADMLAQAEHDPRASALAITPSLPLAEAIQREIGAQLKTLPRSEAASAALANQGAIIVSKDMEEALHLANRYAPEHLGLAIQNAEALVDRIRHAGAVFVGHSTPEALGDYNAGVNHVLPTSGTARFSSPLSVHDFVKRMSVLRVDPNGLERLADDAIQLARAEGLEAHARAVEMRRNTEK